MSLQSEIRANTTTAFAWEKLRAYSTAPSPEYQPSTWVKLFNPPTAYSFDEAWLLCQLSEEQWLAWIPDYGEILLNINEFCR
jgi:hypothetical protein